MLSVASPKITALETAVRAGVAGIDAAKHFQPVRKLVAPDASARSYLNLAAYTPFKVNFDSLATTFGEAPSRAQVLAGDADLLTIAVPTPDGGFERFGIYRSESMEPELAAQFPQISTFAGQGIDDPAATIALDITPQGFHASVIGTRGRFYIDPYFHLNPDAGEVAYYTDDNLGGESVKCLTHDHLDELPEASEPVFEPSLVTGNSWLGGTLRTYRLAIAATGEYTTYHGGATGALAAITTSVVRLNQVYETDFAIHMNLVANEASIIYTNASTDPYTTPSGNPNNADTTIAENQSTLDSVIGSASYDIGHVYHKASSATGNNGLAGGIGVVGNASSKGQGFSAFTAPVGDNFVVDFVAHEMGHQFGGRHNFNSAGGGPGDSYSLGVEPGSGQSIMGYAGLGTTQENILTHSLPQFNANNYVVSSSNAAAQILQYTLTNTSSNGYTSAVKTSTGNSPPGVSVDASTFNIPVSTPFELTATGSDANGDTLTYSWEQLDGSNTNSTVALAALGGINSVPSATTTNGPVFRVFGATTNPTRTFPVLSAVLANRTYDKGEQLPSVARTMRFAVVARDNRAGGGGVAIGRLTVTTVTGAVFSLTSFNSATSVNGGSTQTINWTNTNTATGTISAANVNILLSTDGGLTFPTTLAANTPNDGSQTVTMPYNLGTSTARIKIVPTNNVFFDINNANFTINFATNTSATPSAPLLFTASDTGVSNSDRITKFNNADAASVLQFSVGNTVAGSMVELLADGVVIGNEVATGTITTLSTNGDVTIGTQKLTDGPHSFSARQTENGKLLSTNSVAQPVTIDATAPTPAGEAFVYETAPIRTSFSFDEPIYASGVGSASIVNVDTAAPASTTLGIAGSTATISISGIPDDGNYHALLQAATITDLAGNSPALDSTRDFSFLNGDATLDQFVDTQDFNLLAANFGGAGKVFSQGNFSYDLPGVVDSTDFDLFIAQYGKRLAPPAAAMNSAALPPLFGNAMASEGEGDELSF